MFKALQMRKMLIVSVAIGSMALPLAAATEVWVSDSRGNDATGNGTYAAPYKTIQKGVDEVDAGGTVKIQAGTYGPGEEHYACFHTNRVVIGKSVILDGVDGKDVTHIVGAFDLNTLGAGPAAVRCICITNAAAATGTIIKNLTMRNGGADSVNNTVAGDCRGYGGAVGYPSNNKTCKAWVVDCVISNCVASMGSALTCINALRCQITDCMGSGYGAAVRYSNLLHCLVLRCRNMYSKARPVVAYSKTVNCTVGFSLGSLSQGIGGDPSDAYNCISFGNDSTDITSATTKDCCYVTKDDAHLLFSTANADCRVTAGTSAENGGMTTYLSTFTLPAGERADIDLSGNEFDSTKEACDAGCFQGAATPAAGRITFGTPFFVNGVSNGVETTVYYTTDTWPVSVRLRPIVDDITNCVYCGQSSGSYGYNTMRRFFPQKDGSYVFTPPASVGETFKLSAYSADLVVYAKPNADPATANGSRDNPYPTLQEAVDAVTNQVTMPSRPLVLAFPGTYDEGGAEVGGVLTRLVVPYGVSITVRSLEGPENTVIKGAADSSNTGDFAGCGPNAVRCVVINPATSDTSIVPSVIQGFTLADGHTRCDDYKTNGAAYNGGGLYGAGSNRKVSQAIDCIFTNCAAVRGGAANNCTLIRCKLYDCHGYGGVMRNTTLASCYVDPSCTLGAGPADATAGSVLGPGSYAVLTTAPEATAPDSDSSLYSTLFASHVPASGNAMWGSVTTNAAAKTAENGCAYVYDANFADQANGDWRLRTTTPARYACRLPEPGSSAYGSWAWYVTFYAQSDIDGNPLCVTDGVPLPGCWQTTVGPKSAFVDAANGGLAVAGGTVGDNAVSDGFALTVSQGSGSRLCLGYMLNGVMNLFADAASGTVTAADVAECPYGVVVSAIYSKDWYVNPTGDDTRNDGYTAETPLKTLAAAMAKAEAGDTVHAAAGTYSEGSMVGSDDASYNMEARVFVPSRVTLVADDGPESTFIVGARDTTESANEYCMGVNAMRCVHMGTRSRLKGFTLTGGYTCWDGDDYEWGGNWSGGGVLGSSSGRSNVLVEDCIISNNWAMYGGGARYVNLVRCRLFENHATVNGGALRDVHANGCVIDRNYSGTSASTSASCYKYTRIVGCTLGPHNYRLNGSADAYAVRLASSSSTVFYDNLVLGSTGAKGDLTNTVTGCVFANSCNNFPVDETCLVVPSSELEVDDDLRPIVGRNAAVDRGSPEALATHSGGVLPMETDALGFPRVMNGTMDVGALEGDWRPMYAKMLDEKGTYLVVTEADSGIVTNAVNCVASISLTDGETLALSYGTAAHPAARRGWVAVTGDGTLTMTLNGETYGTYTVADGAKEFVVPVDGRDAFGFSFAFSGEGSADIYGFSARLGSIIKFR